MFLVTSWIPCVETVGWEQGHEPRGPGYQAGGGGRMAYFVSRCLRSVQVDLTWRATETEKCFLFIIK